MEKRTFTIDTAEKAERVLSTVRLAEEADLYGGITVRSINAIKRTTNPDGTVTTEPLVRTRMIGDEEVEEKYAIVNLNLMTEYQRQNAEDLIASGEFEKATNNTMSIGLPIAEAEKFTKGQPVDVHVVSVYSEKVDDDILVARTIIATKAVKAKSAGFGRKLRKATEDEQERAKKISEALEQ